MFSLLGLRTSCVFNKPRRHGKQRCCCELFVFAISVTFLIVVKRQPHGRFILAFHLMVQHRTIGEAWWYEHRQLSGLTASAVKKQWEKGTGAQYASCLLSLGPKPIG